MPATLGDTHLGYGLVESFRRVNDDFRGAHGADLVRSNIGQILGTRKGELSWDPNFGTDLDRYRHQGITEELAGLLHAELVEALTIYDPRVQVIALDVRQPTDGDTTLQVVLDWALVDTNSPDNEVILGPVTQEVTI